MGNAFTLLMGSSVVIFLFCYLFRRPVLYFFGASDASYNYADAYLQIYLLGTTCSMLSTGLNGFINAQGFPGIGMLTTVIGAVLNLILDPVFIFVLQMDVRGAALATVISQTVSIVVPLTLFLPAAGFGVDGVFLAEPVSNLIGGLASFCTMWVTVYRKLEE